MDEFPKFSWALEPGALYTFLLEDNDVGIPPGKLVHFLATNIPGNFWLKLHTYLKLIIISFRSFDFEVLRLLLGIILLGFFFNFEILVRHHQF